MNGLHGKVVRGRERRGKVGVGDVVGTVVLTDAATCVAEVAFWCCQIEQLYSCMLIT